MSLGFPSKGCSQHCSPLWRSGRPGRCSPFISCSRTLVRKGGKDAVWPLRPWPRHSPSRPGENHSKNPGQGVGTWVFAPPPSTCVFKLACFFLARSSSSPTAHLLRGQRRVRLPVPSGAGTPRSFSRREARRVSCDDSAVRVPSTAVPPGLQRRNPATLRIIPGRFRSVRRPSAVRPVPRCIPARPRLHPDPSSTASRSCASLRPSKFPCEENVALISRASQTTRWGCTSRKTGKEGRARKQRIAASHEHASGPAPSPATHLVSPGRLPSFLLLDGPIPLLGLRCRTRGPSCASCQRSRLRDTPSSRSKRRLSAWWLGMPFPSCCPPSSPAFSWVPRESLHPGRAGGSQGLLQGASGALSRMSAPRCGLPRYYGTFGGFGSAWPGRGGSPPTPGPSSWGLVNLQQIQKKRGPGHGGSLRNPVRQISLI